MSAIRYWLWLSGLTRVSARAKTALVRHYGGAEEAYFAPEGEYAEIEGVSRRDAELLEERDLSEAARILRDCREQDIRILTLQDADYPRRLRSIAFPPVVLYIKGKPLSLDDEPAVAVIGTRRATPYGMKMARQLAGELCACGATVISGLTTGIDGAAARGALLAGGRCIGVLGTAHDQDNGELARHVAEEGTLISEYPPGTESLRSFFRERNRLTAGLSVAVLAVEAPEKSGTRLFVGEALEQGKEIFAVPGNADAEASRGTNAILKEGGHPATCGWDVLEELVPLFPGRLHPAHWVEPGETEEKADETESFPPPAAKKDIDKGKDKGYIVWQDRLAELNESQLLILKALEEGDLLTDELLEKTALRVPVLMRELTVLTVKGLVRRLPGNRISACRDGR